MDSKSLTQNTLKYLLFILSGALMVIFFSASTSPLYPYYKGWDSSFFQVIGKEWNKGLIPYRDMFDQKGPAIFFVELLGFFITGNKYGILLLQIISAIISIIFIYKTIRRSTSEKTAIVGACIGIFFFSSNYEFGNLVEEYINPFLIICFYFISVWIDEKTKDKPDHNPVHALFYGITFGLCVMSRATNAVSVCIAVLFIVIYLFTCKAWLNLLKNSLAFIIGTLAIIVPFMIYFALKDCTYDFWYGTILFNISYASNSHNNLLSFIKGFPRRIGDYAIICAGCINIIRKRHFNGFMFIMIGLGTEFLLMNIMNYAHYSMITFPLLPIAMHELKKVYNSSTNYIRKLSILVTISTLLLASYRMGKEIITLSYCYKDYGFTPNEASLASYRQLYDFASQVPEDERNSFVGYEINSNIYLDLDISPACKFFAYQDWQAEFSDEFNKELNAEFEAKRPKWIFFSGNKAAAIQNLLNSNYEIYASEPVIYSTDESQLILYRLND